MDKKRQEEIQFGVLDALSVILLPTKHLAAAVASFLLNNGAGLSTCIDGASRISKLLAQSEKDELELYGRIIIELQRQVQVKVARIRRRTQDDKRSLMGSQVERGTRINRVCHSIFGDPVGWQSIKGVGTKASNPYFNWFKRLADGVVVAGFHSHWVDELAFGFVYKKSGPVRFGLLPSRSRTVGELLVYLGLHPRLVGGPDVRVDWDRRSFLVAGTNRLPWVYP